MIFFHFTTLVGVTTAMGVISLYRFEERQNPLVFRADIIRNRIIIAIKNLDQFTKKSVYNSEIDEKYR